MIVVIVFQVVYGVLGRVSPAVGVRAQSSLSSHGGGYEAVRSQRGGVSQEGDHATGGGSRDLSESMSYFALTRSRGLLGQRANLAVAHASVGQRGSVPGLACWQESIAAQSDPKSTAGSLGVLEVIESSDVDYCMEVRLV